jgi:hypothetical protein
VVFLKNRSLSTNVQAGISSLEKRIKKIFNRDVFSIYDGIVEAIDLNNGLLNVRIPDLNNSLYKNCPIMIPCSTDTSIIYPNFKVNSTVIVGFKQFSLAQPIVLGSTFNNVNVPFDTNSVKLVNGNCKISLSGTNEIIITNGTSTLIINDSGINISGTQINLTGSYISANGEDLSNDDIGAM